MSEMNYFFFFSQFYADVLQCEYDMTHTIYRMQKDLREELVKQPIDSGLLFSIVQVATCTCSVQTVCITTFIHAVCIFRLLYQLLCCGFQIGNLQLADRQWSFRKKQICSLGGLICYYVRGLIDYYTESIMRTAHEHINKGTTWAWEWLMNFWMAHEHWKNDICEHKNITWNENYTWTWEWHMNIWMEHEHKNTWEHMKWEYWMNNEQENDKWTCKRHMRTVN